MPPDPVPGSNALPEQLPVSANNPCPFLRALVAGGFVDGHSVALPKISSTIQAASGETGLRRRMVWPQTFGVALIANGFGPLRLIRSLWSGVTLDQLRNGPLDKHGGGSRILDAEAHVHEGEIDRLACFGSDYPNPCGGTERGLNAAQIKTYMRSNIDRDGADARWYFPLLMRGEWPVLLRVMGKGEGDNRYLSVAEVRTLFVDRRLPERIVTRLLTKPRPAGLLWRLGRATIGFVVALVVLLGVAWTAFPDRTDETLSSILPKSIAEMVPPALPAYEAPKTAHWLDQGWTVKDRQWFHHATQGTATFPVPYKWFMALEQPYLSPFGTPGRISDSSYLERFGFIPSPKSTDSDSAGLKAYGFDAAADANASPAPAPLPGLAPTPADNNDGLPVGFARLSGAVDPATGAAEPDKIGLTCAACHTGSIRYKGTSIRFDGGPAMVDLRKLEKAMGFAMMLTQWVPTRFSRFAEQVLGAGASESERTALKKGLKAATDFALTMQAKNYQKAIEAKGQSETQEGFGRLDALNRIGNQVFYLDMAVGGLPGYLDNQEAIAAPVSYPPIWTVPWFSWAQYDASISQPLIRNAGEALGVFAAVNFSPDRPANRLFRSSIAIENLVYIENMLHGPDPFAADPPRFGGLTSPKWPGKLFPGDKAWTIDQAKVDAGRKLYGKICVECHLGPVDDQSFDTDEDTKALSFWRRDGGPWNKSGDAVNLVEKPVADMRTDPGQSSILRTRMVKVPGFFGLDPAKDLKGCGLPPSTSTTDMPYALALMDVVQRASDKWFDEHPVVDRSQVWGKRKNCPNPAPKPIYRARPLNGVWATAPYLHNGSVPSLYWLLSPAADRPTSFCQGARDYDPITVGFAVPAGGEASCKTGQTRFMASDSKGPIKGNSVMGHSFEGPERDPHDYPPGVIGRGFSDTERWQLIEYLKTL
ncbi:MULTISPECIES: di-heme-cytochrome C peroxidase [unclassified Bradyrhizobium]|uniref:di-heme-cytochrome C peroxidase n=1 Tax=unclassified Bradyrhizobium TaxID=2631580 RepID=UPI0028EBB9A4|nr:MULTISPECIES: di-heme-cytochrome C peroxidase [unclassified Bradyrhizobium]